MPAVQLLTPSPSTDVDSLVSSPLPQLLQTPSGLAILEIQGTIHGPFQHSAEDQSSPPRTIPTGRLQFPLYTAQDPSEGKWMKKVYLYVGKHQRLTGEIKRLAKPLAVIRKTSDSDGISGGETKSSHEDLEIVDIIKFKLLFSGRPEPVGE